jgi:hypothetical protein
MRRLTFLLFLFFICACAPSELTWPSDSELSCSTKPNEQHMPEALEMRMTEAITCSYHAKNSLWNIEDADRKDILTKTLQDFAQGKSGVEVKNLRINNLTAPGLHAILIQRGFRHQRNALVVHPDLQPKLFWLRSGKQVTEKPSDPDMLPMDIYDHPDGSLVRIKAWGIPDPTRQTKHPEPYVSKSVVFDRREHCIFSIFHCHLDTSWNNEAFKITDDGFPVPKSASPKHGFSFPSDLVAADKELWINIWAQKAHTDLIASYKHCDP